MLKGLAPIGRGGQKQALSAVHDDHGDVVVKLFHPHGNLERIVREIKATRALASAQVPELLDFGTLGTPTGEVVWLIERRVPGKVVREHLASGALTNEAVLVIAFDVLRPLAQAEKARIVHRDVKPENILLDSGSGRAYLIDFGLVRMLDMVSVTATAQAIGPATLGYSPLEQLRNQKREIDSRADLFSLGVTLYECCEGKNPLLEGARDHLQVIRRTENDPLPRITRKVEASGEFAELVYTMTRPRRDHRPGSVADALTWLEQIVQAATKP